MVLPFHLCSHIQNAFRARHKAICVPHTTQNLAILSVLLRTGFLQNVTRGTTAQASPEQFHTVGDAQRRIWADLKYRDDRPVLSSMSLISKPSKKIYMSSKEILLLCSGRRVQSQKPLRMGEIAVVRTDSKEHEWLEAREAVQLGLEGEVICRAM